MAKAALKEAPQLADGSDDEGPDTILEYSIDIAEQERPPVVPIGDYRAVITGVQKKYGKDTGRPYLNIKWSISPDDLPADFIEEIGVQEPITVYHMLFGCEDNPRSRFSMHQFCESIGAPMSNRINVQDFMNQEGRITVEHGQDLEGNPNPRVRRVSRA